MYNLMSIAHTRNPTPWDISSYPAHIAAGTTSALLKVNLDFLA